MEVSRVGGCLITTVDSDDIESAIELLLSGKVDGFAISPWTGYRVRDLSWLVGLPVRALMISNASEFDVSPLQCFRTLEVLVLSAVAEEFSFSSMNCLRWLSFEWSKKIDISTIPKNAIQHLSVNGLAVEGEGLGPIAKYSSVEELEIVNSKITSLKGVEGLKRLRRIELYYVGRLVDFDGLASCPLEDLWVGNGKRIPVHEYEKMKACKSLRSLRIQNSGELPNVGFVSGMHGLKEFRFVGTKIADGDLSPLIGVPVVAFLGARHYSHKPSEFDNGIR